MKTKEVKKEILEEISLSIDLLDLLKGSLEEVSRKILNIKNVIKIQHPHAYKTYKKFSMKFEYDYDGGHMTLFGVRMETNEELEQRIKKEERIKEAELKDEENKIKKDLKLYKELQKKYGKEKLEKLITKNLDLLEK